MKNPGYEPKQLGLFLVEMHNKPWIDVMRAIAQEISEKQGFVISQACGKRLCGLRGFELEVARFAL